MIASNIARSVNDNNTTNTTHTAERTKLRKMRLEQQTQPTAAKPAYGRTKLREIKLEQIYDQNKCFTQKETDWFQRTTKTAQATKTMERQHKHDPKQISKTVLRNLPTCLCVLRWICRSLCVKLRQKFPNIQTIRLQKNNEFRSHTLMDNCPFNMEQTNSTRRISISKEFPVKPINLLRFSDGVRSLCVIGAHESHATRKA